MTTHQQVYVTVDKSTWGDGPWQHEPDKLVWVDAATGLDCMIRRGPSGALCGYVGVPPQHPYHEVRHDDVPVDVHGGLTYGDVCEEEGDPAKAICHVPQPGRPADVYWLGFDCAHYCDYTPGHEARMREIGASLPPLMAVPPETYKDLAYVKSEVERLAKQLV